MKSFKEYIAVNEAWRDNNAMLGEPDGYWITPQGDIEHVGYAGHRAFVEDNTILFDLSTRYDLWEPTSNAIKNGGVHITVIPNSKLVVDVDKDSIAAKYKEQIGKIAAKHRVPLNWVWNEKENPKGIQIFSGRHKKNYTEQTEPIEERGELALAALMALSPFSANAYAKSHGHKAPITATAKDILMNNDFDASKLVQIFPKTKFTPEEAKNETAIIHKIAQRYGLKPQQEVLLFTIRRIENGTKGGGMEFGCGDPGPAIRNKERSVYQAHPDLIAARSALQNKWSEQGITDSSDSKLNTPEVQQLFTSYNTLRTKYGLPIMKNNDPRRWEGNYLKSLELQARVAAGTIVKHSDSNGNFNLKGFANSWCPVNPGWVNLATSIIDGLKKV